MRWLTTGTRHSSLLFSHNYPLLLLISPFVSISTCRGRVNVRHKVLRTKTKKKKKSRRGGSSRGRARCATDGLLDAETKKVGIGFYVGETTTTHFPSRCFTHTKRNVVADCSRGFRLDEKDEELSRVGKPFFPIREPIDRSRTARRGEYYRRAK